MRCCAGFGVARKASGEGPKGVPRVRETRKTGTQEDGEDAQVLDGVVDADVLVTRAGRRFGYEHRGRVVGAF